MFLDRSLPLVEMTAQAVVNTRRRNGGVFLNGMTRHLDQRERSM